MDGDGSSSSGPFQHHHHHHHNDYAANGSSTYNPHDIEYAIPPFENNPWGIACFVILPIFLIVAAAAIVIRLKSRRMRDIPLEANDYLVVTAWPFAAALVACNLFAVYTGSGGKHENYVAFKNIMKSTEAYIPIDVFWAISNSLVKISILHQYISIFGLNRTFRRVAQAVMVLVALFGLGVFVTTFLLCRPLPRFYDPDVPGVCGSWNATLASQSSINMAIDILIVILPIPIVLRLNMSPTRKLAVIFVFGLGLIVVAITAFRTTISIMLSTEDFTYPLAMLAITTTLEPLLGIVIACMPAFPAAVKHQINKRKLKEANSGPVSGHSSKPSRDQIVPRSDSVIERGLALIGGRRTKPSRSVDTDSFSADPSTGPSTTRAESSMDVDLEAGHSDRETPFDDASTRVSSRAEDYLGEKKMLQQQQRRQGSPIEGEKKMSEGKVRSAADAESVTSGEGVEVERDFEKESAGGWLRSVVGDVEQNGAFGLDEDDYRRICNKFEIES